MEIITPLPYFSDHRLLLCFLARFNHHHHHQRHHKHQQNFTFMSKWPMTKNSHPLLLSRYCHCLLLHFFAATKRTKRVTSSCRYPPQPLTFFFFFFPRCCTVKSEVIIVHMHVNSNWVGPILTHPKWLGQRPTQLKKQKYSNGYFSHIYDFLKYFSNNPA